MPLPLTIGSGRTMLGKSSGFALRDAFARGDTSAGDLGTAPTGQTWDMRGAYAGSYPLPAATDGQISSQKFVDVGRTVVYATMRLSQIIRRLECDFSWVDLASGTQFTTLACGISSSANLVDTMLHVTVTNGACTIQKRLSGGAFVTLNTGATSISPSLALANTRHTVRINVVNASARVRVGAFDVTVTDPDIRTIIGPHMFVEHYSATTDVRWPLTIYGVRAGY